MDFFDKIFVHRKLKFSPNKNDPTLALLSHLAVAMEPLVTLHCAFTPPLPLTSIHAVKHTAILTLVIQPFVIVDFAFIQSLFIFTLFIFQPAWNFSLLSNCKIITSHTLRSTSSYLFVFGDE